MRVLAAPDKFKGCASAATMADAMARGIAAAGAIAVLHPLADGGEGTVDVLLTAIGGQRRVTRVTGPLGAPVDAAWALLDDGRAVVEMAAAAGLALVPASRRDPTRTTTRGVGELIAAALDAGATRVIVGMGGSATVDGGVGATSVLGRGPLPLDLACDVDAPLLGPHGAAAVYGPQKGATAAQIATLEHRLRQLSVSAAVDPQTPGAGAAGGLAWGLANGCGATLHPGATLILATTGFTTAGVDLVLTGEGRLDATSARGKVVGAVAAAAHPIPCVALVGQLGDRADAVPLTAAFALAPGPASVDDAVRHAPQWMERLTTQVVRLFSAGGRPR